MFKNALLILFFIPGFVMPQSVDSVPKKYKFSISGYLDAYYGYDFLRPKDDTEPYVYSATKHNELDINVGYVNVFFESERTHASFSPAVGTLIEINYAPEPAFWRHLYECYVGFKPASKSKWWVDAGVFSSPFTNESAISMDHITYTRSLGSENSPYYLSGLRSIHPIAERWQFTWYYLNGWQRIRKINEYPSFATDLQFKPTEKWQLNWTTFVGDSRYDSMPALRNRYFTDVHAVYNMSGKLSASICLTGGLQSGLDSPTLARWGSAALQLRYRLNSKHSLAAKYDMYHDPQQTILQNVTGNLPVSIQSITANYSYQFAENALFRMEWRGFKGKENVFFNHENRPVKNAQMLVTSVAVRF